MLYKFLLNIMKVFLKIFYPYEIIKSYDFERINKKTIICSNHVSNLDAIFICLVLNCKVYFLAKKELFKNCLISYFLKKMGAISVDRGNNDINAIKNALNVLNSNKILGIFIEGKRSKNGEFLRPKSGAAFLASETNSIIIPVCITPENRKKIKLFSKTKINFGVPIENLKLEAKSYKEIRAATEYIMNEIRKLR